MSGNKEPSAKPKNFLQEIKPFQFQKGISGNPSGRPKSLGPFIKGMTDGGKEMVLTMLAIMRGAKVPGAWGSPSYKDIQESAKWLYEQVFGKLPILGFSELEKGDIRRILLIEMEKKPIGEDTTSEGRRGEVIPGQTVEAEQPLQDQNQV